MTQLIVILLLMWKINFNMSVSACTLQLSPKIQGTQPMYFLEKRRQFNSAKPALRFNGETDVPLNESENLAIFCLKTNPITKKSLVEENFTASCKHGQLEVTKSWFNISHAEKSNASDITSHEEKSSVAEIGCKEKLNFRKKKLKQQCSGELSELFEIGVDVLFRYNSKKIPGIPVSFVKQKWSEEIQWRPQYSVCFDKSVKEVMYTTHTINGAVIKARQTGISDSVEFKFGSEFRFRKGEKINPEEAFKLDNMVKVVIEDASFLPYFNYEKKNLIPKTLVPPKDMLFINSKPASYFYLNAAPMWKNVECTWENLENHIRVAASRYETDLIIYTGVYEKYRINERIVTLDKHRTAIRVPLYFWKIVYHRINRSGIAFVMNNDPFNANPRLCKPKDKRVGRTWPVYNDAYRLGLLYPCLVNDLRAILKSSYELPSFQITKELYYPTS